MKKNLHKSTNPQANIEDAWNQTKGSVIDVRSPNEFNEGHIPGAINIPILENNERKTIGILYKEFGQEKAIDQGYKIADAKLDHLSEQYKKLKSGKPVIVYCARGGMRSQVVTAFLRYLKHEASQLTGGYKAFRNWNLDLLEQYEFSCPITLHGKTGVGKTLVLEKLDNSLDLEGLAAHRGSIIGGIGKSPVSQKTFEANLLRRLQQLDNSKPVFIEGESRKIGDVSIPNNIFTQMRSAKALLLEASMKTRVNRTINEYITKQPSELSVIRKTISLLTKDLGKKPVSLLIEMFDAGNYSECFEYILLNYYDRKYAHSMKKLIFAQTISTEDLNRARNEILDYAGKQV